MFEQYNCPVQLIKFNFNQKKSGKENRLLIQLHAYPLINLNYIILLNVNLKTPHSIIHQTSIKLTKKKKKKKKRSNYRCRPL